MKKLIWIIVAVLICFLIALYFILDSTSKEKTIQVESAQIIDFSIEDRVTLKTSDAIYVGNSQKELENNFYDIKIINTQEGVAVWLNKLWYETYGNDYIQDEYLARICRELSGRLNVNSGTEQFEYVLYKYIKDNYMKVRQNEVIEEILTEKFSLKFELEDNVVKLIIRGN